MMTDTHTPDSKRHSRMVRPVEGRVVAGVAEGIAQRLQIGTGWVRIGFVIASLFGGLGILLYAAGWLGIPDERDDESILERYLGGVTNWSSWIGVGLIVMAALVLLGGTGFVRGDVLFATVLIVVGILLYRGDLTRHDGGGPQRPADPTPPDGGEPEFAARIDDRGQDDRLNDDEPTNDEEGGGAPPPAPPPFGDQRAPRRRERSVLGSYTIGIVLLTLGGIGFADAVSDRFDPSVGTYVAAAVLVIGVGLLVASWFGRARWLILPGVFLVPVLFVASLMPFPLRGDFGDRTITGQALLAQSDGSEEMAIGEFRVDLRDLVDPPPGEGEPFVVRLGIGRLVVVVPPELSVDVDGRVGFGELSLEGTATGGMAVDGSLRIGDRPPDLRITAEVGIGKLEVTRPWSDGDAPSVFCSIDTDPHTIVCTGE